MEDGTAGRIPPSRGTRVFSGGSWGWWGWGGVVLGVGDWREGGGLVEKVWCGRWIMDVVRGCNERMWMCYLHEERYLVVSVCIVVMPVIGKKGDVCYL